MAKRSTIGANPLDAVVPKAEPLKVAAKSQPKAPARQERSESRPRPARASASERVVKERLTIHLPVDLIDRVKNAVYWTPGLTLAGLAEAALSETVKGLEKDNGGAFEQRTEELRGGRPIK